MKKTHILFGAVLLALIGTKVIAQPFWGGLSGTIPTFTDGSVGIGTLTPPTDAALHVYNNPCTYYQPETKIERWQWFGGACAIMGPYPNYFEILNTTAMPGGGSTTTMIDVFDHRGWLGINTSSPLQALHVNGNGLFEGGQLDLKMPTDGAWRNVNANSHIHGVTMSAGPEGAYMQLRAKYNSDPGAISIACVNSENSTGTTFFSFDGASGPWHYLMRIKPNGQVAIGENIIAPENLPAGYNLYVSKGILTEKLKVALPTTSNWSDFVFQKDYKLMPLTDVESYIREFSHLPEVPSAEEIVKEGIDVAGMDAKLLQKIEELTLYVIQQQKQLEQQKAEIESLKNKSK